METKYIFVDIDGTLFDQDEGIPTSAVQAIKQAQQNNHKVFICTGRPFTEVDELFRDIQFDGYIFACGGVIEINDKIVHKETMLSAKVKEIKQILDNYGIGYALEGTNQSYFSSDAYKCFYAMYFKEYKDDALVKERMKKVNFTTFTSDDDINFDDITKLSIYSKKEAIHDAMKEIEGMHVVLHSLDFNGYINYEVSCPHITKASGIDVVLEKFQASKQHTIAIGDSMNDASMLAHCEIGISMGNACDELKQLSTYTTKHILEDGLYHALKHYDLI